MPTLFNKKILNTYMKNHSVPEFKDKISVIQNWQKNLETIKRHNEKELQAAFLKGIFGNVLGYVDISSGQGEWTMRIEASTEIDASAPDGILGFYSTNEEHTQAVIELKGPEVSLDKKQKRSGKNYGTPVDQAFSYTSKYDKCKWVIVSNMIEIRLYKVGRSQEYFEVFHLSDLDQEQEFKRLHLLLSRDNLINKSEKSFTMELSEKVEEHTEDISVKFYNLFKNTRINLFEHLKENNPDIDREILLEKAQKFLDRIIFIAFCEDIGLLPNRILHKAIERGESSFSTSETTVWSEIRGVFRSIDEGNPSHNINAYNGGLFKYDEVLDNLTIKNEFFEVIDDLSAYDFDSDLDVNILGHIFEQSISDIEELKANIRNEKYNKEQSKRKKDGIYYTPKYITSYIVENSIGEYLEDIRKELGEEELPDIESASTPQVKGRYKNQHLRFYHEYEEKLKEIKILDPACGSGAFLNQAFDYLLNEHKWVRKQISLLEDKQTSIFGLESMQRNILKNNLYGVDLNEESANITKLSLWLKTANKNEPLVYLDNNIKCGNSLIDDPEIGKDKAFDWEHEFPQIINEGGFNIVIGNPPYVRQEEIIELKPYLKKNYEVYMGTADLYCYFFEKGINLLKENGYFSFIVSNKFTRTEYGKNLRKYLLNYTIKKYKIFEQRVFSDVEVDPCVIVIKKRTSVKKNLINYNDKEKIPQHFFDDSSWSFASKKEHYIKNKIINTGTPLKSLDILIYRGILTGLNEAFIIDNHTKDRLLLKDPNSSKIIKPLLRGRNIYRYNYNFDNEWLIFTRRGINIDNYPAIKKYLKRYYKQLKPRNNDENIGRKPGNYKWYEIQDTIDYYKEFNRKKLVWPMVSTNKSNFCLVESAIYLNNKCYLITGNLIKYILAIMNSSLAWFYFLNNESKLGENSLEIRKNGVMNFPIPENKKHKKVLEKKSELMVNSNKKLSNLQQTNVKNLVQKITSKQGPEIGIITNQDQFYNQIYSGRARKVRNITVNINDTILTLYSDKSGSGKYELMKFEVKNKYKRQYLKLYLENLTEDQLEKINNYSGGLVKKILQIEIPDYNKDHVVKKVIDEWNKLQKEIKDLEDKIEKTDNEIDQMVYDLYGLTDEEIKIVEESINQ